MRLSKRRTRNTTTAQLYNQNGTKLEIRVSLDSGYPLSMNTCTRDPNSDLQQIHGIQTHLRLNVQTQCFAIGCHRAQGMDVAPPLGTIHPDLEVSHHPAQMEEPKEHEHEVSIDLCLPLAGVRGCSGTHDLRSAFRYSTASSQSSFFTQFSPHSRRTAGDPRWMKRETSSHSAQIPNAPPESFFPTSSSVEVRKCNPISSIFCQGGLGGRYRGVELVSGP